MSTHQGYTSVSVHSSASNQKGKDPQVSKISKTGVVKKKISNCSIGEAKNNISLRNSSKPI